MIIVRIDGGLGNQMSQFAFMCKLKKYYPNTRIKADYSAYKHQKIHNGFELTRIFNITDEDLPQASFFEIIKSKNNLLGGNIVYQKYESGYAEDLSVYHLSENRNYYFHGTWHSYDYSEILDELRTFFKFKNQLTSNNKAMENAMRSTNSVSIHVRRGDYIKEGLAIISKDYYRKAVKIIQERREGEELEYFIFSDDKEFVKKYFDFLPAERLHFVEGNFGEKSYIDMQLMSCCKYNILANSTFSYWAALLNDNSEKIVIKPFMQTPERESWVNEGWIRLK